MSQHFGHVHAHDHLPHTHAPAGKLRQAFFLTIAILAIEIAGGLLSHSLALLSDAGHVLTDIAALGLSWYATAQSGKPANERMTYGYHRSGILAALINGITLIVVALFILWQAYGRLRHPQPVSSTWMFIAAGTGLVMNLYLGMGMRGTDNLNLRAATLHMLGDAAASAGVIVGALVITFTGWVTIDPLLSILIAVLISFAAWRLVKQTVGILMEGTPHGIQMDRVVASIRGVPGIRDVHDVHVWSIDNNRNALSCHVVLNGNLSIRESQSILRSLEDSLCAQGIGHTTIQTEDGDHPHDDSVLCSDETANQTGDSGRTAARR